jgi:hypothetical protein
VSSLVPRWTAGFTMAVVCAIWLHPRLAASPNPPALQGSACGSAVQQLDRGKADVGIDRNIMSRTRTLMDSAQQSGQAPPPSQTDSLTEDSVDSLSDAADQTDAAAQQVGQRLDALKLPRQASSWNSGVSRFQSARSQFMKARQQTRIPGSGGVGPQVIYEAANNVAEAGDALNQIGVDGQFVNLEQGNVGVHQGAPDTPPPPNPGPDPLQELMRRLQALNGRMGANASNLNAIRNLAVRNLAQANQHLAGMARQLANADDALQQLAQALSPCLQPSNTAQNNSNQNQNTPSDNGDNATQAAHGISAGAKLAVIGGVTAGGALAAAAAYKAANPCGQLPSTTDSTYTSCVNGLSCSACAAWLDAADPYCSCIEQKMPDQIPGGTCGQLRDAVQQVRDTGFCRVPATPADLPFSRKR